MESSIHIFDRKRLKEHRNRCTKHIKDHDFLIRWTQKQLSERLDVIRRDFPLALQIGPPSQTLPEKITECINANLTSPATLLCDEEFLPFGPKSFDLIFSALSLHSVNDLPGALLQINKALKPDGLFLAAMFGGETLHELRQSLMEAELKTKGGVSPRIFPFADKQQMGALLQRAGFALPVVDSEILTVTYENIFKLMHDLRYMGENNIIHERRKTNPGKELFLEAAKYYGANFSEPSGRIYASFEIIFMIGWAPHKSQQQPLRPGSAQTRLADALKTTETSL